MRYEVRSVMMERPRKGALPDVYNLALIQPEDHARPPMLVRYWHSVPHGGKSILQVGHTSEKAAELRNLFGEIVGNQTDKGYEIKDGIDGDFNLIDLLGPDGISKTVWWFQLPELGQSEKIVGRLKFYEEVDREPEHELIVQMLTDVAAGKSPVIEKPATARQASTPVKLTNTLPPAPKPEPALEMPGWGEWA